MRQHLLSALSAGALLLAACGPSEQASAPAPGEPAQPAAAPAAAPAPEFANVTHERLVNARSEPGQWLTYNGDLHEQHYSPLDQINDQNVGQLGLAYAIDFPTNQPIEVTPLYVDGVLYVTNPWSKVYAYDARTGAELWAYDPKVPGEWNVNVCCGMDTRGLAAYEGKIIFGTLDGRLIALDAKTGTPVWSVKSTPDEGPYSIKGAPRAADGKVFIGSTGGELGIRGYLDAYDVDTGARLWRFWTVPGDPAKGFENDTMRMAAETWKTPGWWNLGGGGPVWDGITYDPETDLVIFGTGNGTPWSAVARDPNGGDNLFTDSIVAVHADDGSYAWHYQEVPWETWDYDSVQQLTVVDLEIGGRMRHVVMQASKHGHFYVLDAATGELISAEAYTGVNWALGINADTGRPIEAPGARYDVENEAFNLLPGPAGSHAWQSMSWSPKTGLVYIPTTEMWYAFAKDPDFQPKAGGQNLGVDMAANTRYLAEHPDAPRGTAGRLTAWDPVNSKMVWQTEAIPYLSAGLQATAGALATGGNIVVHGSLPQQKIIVNRATDGQELWSFDAKTGVLAGPISYELDGVQYIAVAVGGQAAGGYYAPNGARLLVFKLGGTAELADVPDYVQPPFVETAQFATPEVIAHGESVFSATCSLCHAQGGAGRTTFPDLRRSQALTDQALFDAIVLDGALSANGMASFKSRLAAEDTVGLRAYLVSQAENARAGLAAPQEEGHFEPGQEEKK